MLQSAKYLYVIRSKWMSLDPTRAFKPFLTSLIIKEQIEKTFDEKLSEAFYIEYGFKLPYFILTNIIYTYIADGYAENQLSFLYFDVKKMRELPQIENSDFQIFNVQYESFIKEFINYCKSEELNQNKAERIILSFIKTYDTDIIVDKLTINEVDDMEVEKYLFYTFIKEIREKNLTQYEFLLKLCQGNLIKSFLFNEEITTPPRLKSKIFLDSPILYRVLGYYGEYYLDEYNYLINLWKNQGYELYVFEHNLIEMEALLKRCIDAIEDPHFNYAKSPQIIQTFKELGWDSIDIDNEIQNLQSRLNSVGIDIYYVDYNSFSEEHIESQEQIKTIITTTYSNNNSTFLEEIKSYGINKMIDVDATSVVCSYAIRQNNKNDRISESQFFYVTNNSGLVSAIHEYNQKKYPKTVSPIIRDTLIGMIACSSDMGKVHEIVEKKIISLCYTTYRPSRKVLETFTSQIESMKSENLISDEQYLALKHNRSVLPILLELTEGRYSKINYTTINKLLVKVEETIIEPIKIEYESRLEKISQEKSKISAEIVELKKNLESKNNDMIKDTKDKEIQEIKRQNALKEIDKQKERKTQEVIKNTANSINYAVIGATLILIVIYIVNAIQEGMRSIIGIILLTVSIIAAIYNGIIIIVEKYWENNIFVKKIILKKTKKISDEYEAIKKELK